MTKEEKKKHDELGSLAKTNLNNLDKMLNF